MLLRTFTIIAMLVAAVGAGLKSAPAVHAAVTLTVDSTQRYQTWEGWEVTVENFHCDNSAQGDSHPVPQSILDQLIDDAVNNLGLTALRLEAHPVGKFGAGLEVVNDNNDPFDLDTNSIDWTLIDPYVRCIVVPFKTRVEAHGEEFTLNLHAVAWGSWHWLEPASDPGQEYAELMMACLDHLKNNFGITPDYLTIYNEPDNGKEGPDVVIRGMKKLATRMKAAGYTTKLRFPDTSTVSAALSWFDRLVATEPGLLSQVGHFSFHGYGGFSTATLNAIRSRAQKHGIATSQTEWWFENNHPPDIVTCMTEANITLYQPYALGAWPDNNPSRGLYGVTYSGGTFPLHNYTGYVRGPDWYDIYHYSAFIRPGDVRIKITSLNSVVKPVAFLKPQRKVVVVAINSSTAKQEIQIQCLPAGAYGLVFSAPGQLGVELPSVTIEEGKPLVFQMPAQAIATFFPTFPAKDSSHTWSFEKDKLGALPTGWKAETTRQKTPLATWQVTEDESASSGRKVLALTKHERQSYARDICWTNAVPFFEGELEVRFKAVGGRMEKGGGIIWRVQDRDNYYGVRTNYALDSQNSVGLYCTVNGDRIWKAYAHDVSLSVGKWHTLKVVHRGAVIQVYLDGKKLLEATHDNSPLTKPGGVGVWTKGDAVTSFDELRVKPSKGKAEARK